MSSDARSVNAISGCLATVVFGSAWFVMFVVVGVGAGYGSDDPLLIAYAAVLVLGPALAWWGIARGRAIVAAAVYAGIVAASLTLGSTYG